MYSEDSLLPSNCYSLTHFCGGHLIMGGQNHQPCSAYLVNSTRLSRSVSQARIHLELANVELENLLLQEISVQKTDRGSLEELFDQLTLSQQEAVEAIAFVCALRQQMQNLLYEDLPPLQQMSLSELGNQLSERGLVSKDSWKKMSQLMLECSFYAVLDYFQEELNILNTLTQSLMDAIPQDCEGHIAPIVEQNQEGNFKVQFATLYQRWHNFQQDFLASSMLSTEIWYAHNQYGSLTHCAVVV